MSTRTNSPKSKAKILVIDDTPLNFEILSEILSTDEYDLTSAPDGETGLERARAEKPDLVLLDLVLPGMMGIEVLEVLKREQPHTTVILTTAYGSEETAVQAMRRGVNDYIINKRPFDPDEVRDVVRRAISESRLRQENIRLTAELGKANEQLSHYAKNLEQTVTELRDANERLKELDQAKASFFSMISHELRHPLTVAKGYLELLETGEAGQVPEDIRRYLHIIDQNFDQLAGMIDDLIDLSRMEAGRFHIELQPIRPASFISHTILSFTSRANEKQLTIENQVGDALPSVKADHMRIVQVLNNLLENAIKFTPEGGKVVVSARPLDQEIEFCVADTGVGIAKNDLERVFERFYQVRREDSTSVGAGLGLAICKEIIKLHGGKIWVESDLGQGSQFYFTLARAPSDQKN